MEKARITIHPAYQIGEISKRLFGAFLEPIGSMVNGSMYNPKHPTADEQGFRRDFINGLKDAQLPCVRMPGGNFVSGWNWKESIGPTTCTDGMLEAKLPPLSWNMLRFERKE